ncbi:MAG: hypothetical protein GWN93_05970 [Deltaproteobacteria bacterium]|nr:hypothetical protein [Deltaproteobacteria bacterium]
MRTVFRKEFLDADFSSVILDIERRDYLSKKLALARVDEAIAQLGFEPLVRMADCVDVYPWSPTVSFHFQKCVRPWLIPFLGETGHPWHEMSRWDVSTFKLWEWDEDYWKDVSGKQRCLINKHQETVCHILALGDKYLRSLNVNGRKKDPVREIQVIIHQESPGWNLNKLTLPDGCVCTRETETYFNDHVVSCRVKK